MRYAVCGMRYKTGLQHMQRWGRQLVGHWKNEFDSAIKKEEG